VDAVRRELWRQLTTKEKVTFKGTRWLLLKNVMDPKSWTRKWPFLRWRAALKMKESRCHEPVRVTHPA